MPRRGLGHIVSFVVGQPGNVGEQRAEGGGRRGDEPGDTVRAAAGFEEALAKVNQMALGGQLAGAAHVVRRDARAAERVRTGDEHVARDDVAVLERKDVERPEELFTLEEQRHRQRAPAPCRGERRARGQVPEREALEEREGMQRTRRRGRCFQTVGDDRLQPLPEDTAQIGRQSVERGALVVR